VEGGKEENQKDQKKKKNTNINKQVSKLAFELNSRGLCEYTKQLPITSS